MDPADAPQGVNATPGLLYPGRSGYVEPAHAWHQSRSNGTVSGTVINGGINVTVPKGTSPEHAEGIARVIDRGIQQKIHQRRVVHRR